VFAVSKLSRYCLPDPPSQNSLKFPSETCSRPGPRRQSRRLTMPWCCSFNAGLFDLPKLSQLQGLMTIAYQQLLRRKCLETSYELSEIFCKIGDRLPQLTVCRSCNTVLFDGPEMEEPIETIRRHNGICPGCGRRLTFDVGNIRISPVARDLAEETLTLPIRRPSSIKSPSKRPIEIVSREAPDLVEKPVPLAVWLRRRNSLTEDGPRVSSPKGAVP